MTDESRGSSVRRSEVVVITFGIALIAVLGGFALGWYLHPPPTPAPPTPIVVVSATGPFASFSLAPAYIPNVTGTPYYYGFGFSVPSHYVLGGQWSSANSNASLFLVTTANWGVFSASIANHHPADYVYAAINVSSNALNVSLQPGGYLVEFIDLTPRTLTVDITASIVAFPAD